MSETYRRLPESRNHRHVIMIDIMGLKLSPQGKLEFFVQRLMLYVNTSSSSDVLSGLL